MMRKIDNLMMNYLIDLGQFGYLYVLYTVVVFSQWKNVRWERQQWHTLTKDSVQHNRHPQATYNENVTLFKFKTCFEGTFSFQGYFSMGQILLWDVWRYVNFVPSKWGPSKDRSLTGCVNQAVGFTECILTAFKCFFLLLKRSTLDLPTLTLMLLCPQGLGLPPAGPVGVDGKVKVLGTCRGSQSQEGSGVGTACWTYWGDSAAAPAVRPVTTRGGRGGKRQQHSWERRREGEKGRRWTWE